MEWILEQLLLFIFYSSELINSSCVKKFSIVSPHLIILLGFSLTEVKKRQTKGVTVQYWPQLFERVDITSATQHHSFFRK